MRQHIEVDYSREAELRLNIRGQNFAVIGAGGIGTWMAILLAMHGAGGLVVQDGDKVEAHNLNRLPFPLRTGISKPRALKTVLRVLRPECHVIAVNTHYGQGVDGLALLPSLTRCFDCTDDVRVQRMIQARCARVGQEIAYYKVGYDNWTVSGYNSVNDMWEGVNYRAGYLSSKAGAVTSVMAASMAIINCLSEDAKPENYEISLLDIPTRMSNTETTRG